MNELNNQNMLQVGTILHGTYKIESYLASGGFGNTYFAKNIEFDETYAIKEFFVKGVCQRDGNSTTISVSNAENTNSFEQQREKFKKEARRLRSLSNPHIVKVYDLFEENGTAYYVMDYVDGENLSARLKRTNAPLTESEVRNYLNQILDGLEAIHNEGMFHLDIKPANIMVDSHDVVKLIDFGASKQQSTVGGATMSTGISYTNGYAPSEQMAQSYDKFGPWTDFYALGATVYKLLTNQDPPSVSDLSEDDTEDKHLALPMPNVSEEMKKLVVWMMQVNRLKRPKSVGEIRLPLLYTNTNSIEETIILLPNPKTIKDSQESSGVRQSEDKKVNKVKRIFLRGIKELLGVCFFLAFLCGIGYVNNGKRFFDFLGVNTVEPEDSLVEDNSVSNDTVVGTVYNIISESNIKLKIAGEICTYSGEVGYGEDKKPHALGLGTVLFPDGRKYVGHLNMDRMMSYKAKFFFPNGDVYEGSFDNNHFNEGTYYVKQTGEKFVGKFDSNGQPKEGKWYNNKGIIIENIK